jgi:hypothetical protein
MIGAHRVYVSHCADDIRTEKPELVDITRLYFSIVPNETWSFQAFLFTSMESREGMQFGIKAPDDATLRWSQLGTNVDGRNFQYNTSDRINRPSEPLCIYEGEGFVQLNGTIFHGTSSGDVQLQFLSTAEGRAVTVSHGLAWRVVAE